jgi:hypothetical protein
VGESAPHTQVRFFTLGDSQYFLGLVALVNSLRLRRHLEPITVLDLGLTSAQRHVLSKECELVDLPAARTRHPYLLQPYASELDPSGVVVIMDSDLIVVGSLDRSITQAREGKIVVFRDVLDQRWFAEWQTLFGLGRAPRKQQYVNSGFIALSTGHFPDFLDRWWAECEGLADRASARTTVSDPTHFADQDALNALLMSEVGVDSIAFQPAHAEVAGYQLKETEVRDPKTLTCIHHGHPVAVLHNSTQHKQWRVGDWKNLYPNAYLTCLRRTLDADDVAIRIPARELPVWLRSGIWGSASLRALYAVGRINRTRRAIRNAVRRLRATWSGITPAALLFGAALLSLAE